MNEHSVPQTTATTIKRYPQIPSDSNVVTDIEPILELDPKEHPGYYITTIQLPYLTSESLGQHFIYMIKAIKIILIKQFLVCNI